jgi:hypothetical protein
MAWKAATISWDTLRGADALWDGLNCADRVSIVTILLI